MEDGKAGWQRGIQCRRICKIDYGKARVPARAEAVSQSWYSCNDALEEPRHDYEPTWWRIVRLENRSRYI